MGRSIRRSSIRRIRRRRGRAGPHRPPGQGARVSGRGALGRRGSHGTRGSTRAPGAWLATSADGSMNLDGLKWEEPAGRDLRETEKAYLDAERRRVIYVAATRARDLLVVPRPGRGPGQARVQRLARGRGSRVAAPSSSPTWRGPSRRGRARRARRAPDTADAAALSSGGAGAWDAAAAEAGGHGSSRPQSRAASSGS